MNTRVSLVGLLALACAFVVVSPASGEEPTAYASCVVDVGERGVCMYGHWLSREVELRLEGCNVFVGEFMAFPGVPPEGVTGRDEDCEEHMLKKAAGRYDLVRTILELGRLYVVTSFSTHNYPVSRRYSVEVQDAIARATEAKSPISAENWESSALWPSVAEQIRQPLLLSKCGGFGRTR